MAQRQPALVEMPAAGLFRVERHAGVRYYEPPPQPLAIDDPPRNDGPRWADPMSHFGTIRYGGSAVAAIAWSIANFRVRVVAGDVLPQAAEGSGIIDWLKGFLTGPPDDPDEDLPVPGTIPRSYFDDATGLAVPHSSRPRFVDLDASPTMDFLTATEVLDRLFGIETVTKPVLTTRDRRVTRWTMRFLYEMAHRFPEEYGDLVGVRYRGRLGWDVHVAWSGQGLVEPASPDNTSWPITAGDRDLAEAARILGLAVPPVD